MAIIFLEVRGSISGVIRVTAPLPRGSHPQGFLRGAKFVPKKGVAPPQIRLKFKSLDICDHMFLIIFCD